MKYLASLVLVLSLGSAAFAQNNSNSPVRDSDAKTILKKTTHHKKHHHKKAVSKTSAAPAAAGTTTTGTTEAK